MSRRNRKPPDPAETASAEPAEVAGEAAESGSTVEPGADPEEVALPDEAAAGEEDGLQHRQWILRRTLPGRRLDKYLADRLKHLSRTAVTKLIRDGYITVHGRKTKPSHEPTEGDVVDMRLPPAVEPEIAPETMPLDILYEDGDMLVLNKAAGVAVHPSRGMWTGTLVNGLLGYVQKLSNYHEDRLRPGVVHRLDKNTTGLIAFAKTEEAHWRLAVQWENRQVKKEYVALVEGDPPLNSDWIEQPIGKHPAVREKYAVRPDGKPSTTFYEVVERFAGYALLRVELHTGRTHQIRVHLSWAGLPIVTDDMYGRRTELWLGDLRPRGTAGGLVTDEVVIRRQALHAWRLRLRHPISNQPMEFEAPLHADMLRTLEALREFRPQPGLDKTSRGP